MTTIEDKIVQQLTEARAMELALVRTLQAHIAMTPSGGYRGELERHLRETRGHADRISRRLADLGHAPSTVQAVYGAGQKLIGQLLALGKAPLDMARGASPEEKLLKNAKDECATEQLEIATYDALEALARLAGDAATARLARDHRADEERMLATLREQLPKLTARVVRAEVDGRSSYDASRTGAAQAVQGAAEEARARAGAVAEEARARAGAVADDAKEKASAAADDAKRQAAAAAGAVRERAEQATGAAKERAGDAARAAQRQAEKVVGAAQSRAEDAAEAAAEATEQQEPFDGYDRLNADTVLRRLDRLSPARLRQVEAYERAHKRRRTVIEASERRRAAKNGGGAR